MIENGFMEGATCYLPSCITVEGSKQQKASSKKQEAIIPQAKLEDDVSLIQKNISNS